MCSTELLIMCIVHACIYIYIRSVLYYIGSSIIVHSNAFGTLFLDFNDACDLHKKAYLKNKVGDHSQILWMPSSRVIGAI